jgi:hypothetical protein
MNTKRVGEIRARAEAATPDLREEEPGWIVSQSLPVSGSRVYSPHVGINFNRDYYLFLHAREDILYLCDEVARLSSALHSSRAGALEEAYRDCLRLVQSEQADAETTKHATDEAYNLALAHAMGTILARAAELGIDMYLAESCQHDWIDMRNEVITSGEMCRKCNKLRAGNESSKGENR